MWYICANPSEIRVIESKFDRTAGDILIRDNKKFLVLGCWIKDQFKPFISINKEYLETNVKLNGKGFKKAFIEQRGTIDFSNEEPFNYL